MLFMVVPISFRDGAGVTCVCVCVLCWFTTVTVPNGRCLNEVNDGGTDSDDSVNVSHAEKINWFLFSQPCD